MLDFNRPIMQAKEAAHDVAVAIDAAIVTRQAGEGPRDYLGASAIGHDCLRKIQWDWLYPVRPEPRTQRIFDRGHWIERYTAGLMESAGFKIVRSGPAVEFSQLGGRFKGHGDGMIITGPAIAGLAYPCLWENKGLGSKGWTKLAKDGLAKVYPAYADQIALYQAYFGLDDNPALFTATNMDTMEILSLLVPFDAERAQAASDRGVRIVEAVTAGETLPRVAASDDDFRCRMCGHRERCWE